VLRSGDILEVELAAPLGPRESKLAIEAVDDRTQPQVELLFARRDQSLRGLQRPAGEGRARE
jgi:hypothetical protein